MSEQDFYKLFARNLTYFMNLNQKTQADISKDLKINKATVSSWVNGTRVPRMDKVDLLCDYFNIKRSDLMEDKAEKQDSNYYLDKDSAEAAQFLFENPEYKVLFDASRKVKKEDIDFVADMIKRVSGNSIDDTGC